MSTAIALRPDMSFAEVRRHLEESLGLCRCKKTAAAIRTALDDLTRLEQAKEKEVENVRENAARDGFARGYERAMQMSEVENRRQKELARLMAMRDPASEFFYKKPFEDEVLPDFLFRVAFDRRYLNERRSDLAALTFLDLDKVKPINDTLGHRVGDFLFKRIISLLAEGIRREGTNTSHFVVYEDDRGTEPANTDASRFGGDEFVILDRGIRHFWEPYRAASRIKAAYDGTNWSERDPDDASLFKWDPQIAQYNPSVSIGIVVLKLASIHPPAEWWWDEMSPEEEAEANRRAKERAEVVSRHIAQLWLDMADKAMYKAKQEHYGHPNITMVEFDPTVGPKGELVVLPHPTEEGRAQTAHLALQMPHA